MGIAGKWRRWINLELYCLVSEELMMNSDKEGLKERHIQPMDPPMNKEVATTRITEEVKRTEEEREQTHQKKCENTFADSG